MTKIELLFFLNKRKKRDFIFNLIKKSINYHLDCTVERHYNNIQINRNLFYFTSIIINISIITIIIFNIKFFYHYMFNLIIYESRNFY